MALPSFLKRKDSPPAAAPLADEAVASARTSARRRLIGAAVLLAVGVIAFPLLFETQPRPIPVDLPIEIPRKDAVAPLPPPPKSAKAAPAAAAPASAVEIAPAAVAEPVAAVAAVAAPAPAPTPAAAASAPKPATPPKAPPAAAAATVSPAAAASESRSARFVVQVGAFADATAVREARSKVEALGLKTYTQAVETDKGTRTRVRAGPFETREEAQKVQARLKAAGLPGALLTL
jgi:DedD protein